MKLRHPHLVLVPDEPTRAPEPVCPWSPMRRPEPGPIRTVPFRRALPFAVLLLLLVAAHGFLETARDSLFLTEQPISRLPWVFLAVAAAVVALTPVQRRVWSTGRWDALALTLAAAGTVTLCFWPASRFSGAVLAVYVWTALFSSVVFVQVWLTADEAFGVGDAKRTFGFIGTGGLVGAVAGSTGARVLLQFASPALLLPAAAALTFAAALLSATAIRPGPTGPAAEPETPVARAVPAELRQDPYLRSLAVLALLTAVSATALDYLFKAAVVSSTAPPRIPRVVANVNMAQSVLALLMELLLVRWLLRRAGVTRSLALLPLVVLAGTAGYAVVGGVAVLFVLKMLDGGVRPSIYRVGTELLYLPVGSAERRILKPSIDTLGQRGGQALASVLLLAMAGLPAPARLGTLAVLLGLIAVGWARAVRTLRPRYVTRFQRQLGSGAIEAPTPGELDLDSAEILVAALGSPRRVEVLTALDLLVRTGRLGLVPSLLLYHPDARVVVPALSVLAPLGRLDVAGMLPFLLRHPESSVRAAAAERWIPAGKPVRSLEPVLEDPASRVRAVALVSLSGVPGYDRSSRERMLLIARRGSLEDRRALAWAIANAPRADLLRVAVRLFRTGDVQIRRELLRAAEAFPAPPARFVSRTIELLTDPLLRPGARHALPKMGSPVRERLEMLLLSEKTPFALARELPAALAEFPPEEAAPALTRRLAQRRGGLDRFRSLRALNQLRRSHPRLPLHRDALSRALEFELGSATKDRALRLAGERLGIAGDGETAGRLLVDLLRGKEIQAAERVFRTLDLLLPAHKLEHAYHGARSTHPARQDAAREVLLELLPVRWREPVLTITASADPAPMSTDALRGSEVTPRSFVAALMRQSSEMVRLLTPRVAQERRWSGVLPALRESPRCIEAADAAAVADAIRELETVVEVADG